MMLLPALPGVGQTINGARLVGEGRLVQFQPGELAKIFLIVFLAGYCATSARCWHRAG